MFRFLIDEATNPRICTGLLRRHPRPDIVTVGQAGLMGQPDPGVLAWAALENRILRILVSSDRSSMGIAAAARIHPGEPCPDFS